LQAIIEEEAPAHTIYHDYPPSSIDLSVSDQDDPKKQKSLKDTTKVAKFFRAQIETLKR